MKELEEKVEEQFVKKYDKILSDKDIEILNANKKIEELTKQIDTLKNLNNMLDIKYHHDAIIDESEEKEKQRQLSKEKVNEFVNNLLDDHAVNINYLPDFVEKQIYKNVFNLLIGLLNKSLGSISINFLGHELTFMITPEKENINNHDTPIDKPNESIPQCDTLVIKKEDKSEESIEKKKKKKKKSKDIEIHDILNMESHLINKIKSDPEY